MCVWQLLMVLRAMLLALSPLQSFDATIIIMSATLLQPQVPGNALFFTTYEWLRRMPWFAPASSGGGTGVSSSGGVSSSSDGGGSSRSPASSSGGGSGGSGVHDRLLQAARDAGSAILCGGAAGVVVSGWQCMHCCCGLMQQRLCIVWIPLHTASCCLHVRCMHTAPFPAYVANHHRSHTHKHTHIHTLFLCQMWSTILPLDVAKSRIQVATPGSPWDVGVTAHLRSLAREGGARALWSGLAPTLARAFPANAAQWLAYELCMSSFVRQRPGEG